MNRRSRGGGDSPTSSFRNRCATVSEFSPHSAAPTIEDTGTAQLTAGAAKMRLDHTFASAIDITSPYRVFVTPDGDTRGLYVTSKTPQGFIVREAQAGRSTVTFGYRIVAASIGEGGKRMMPTTTGALPRAPIQPLPKVHVPRLSTQYLGHGCQLARAPRLATGRHKRSAR